MEAFRRLASLPPYVFNITGEMKVNARRRGEDIIDFGMGNPDGATPQAHRRQADRGRAEAGHPSLLRSRKGIPRLRKAICNWYKRRYDVDLDPEHRGHRHHRLEGGHRPPLPRHPRLARHRPRPQPQLPHPHLRPRHRRSPRRQRRRCTTATSSSTELEARSSRA